MEQKELKKSYVTPEIQVFELKNQGPMLAATGPWLGSPFGGDDEEEANDF